MRIAFIIPARGRSGGVRVTVVAANRLLDRGHAVRILYRRSPVTLRKIYRNAWYRMMYSGNHDWLQDFKGKTFGFKDITECEFYKTEIIVGVGLWVADELAALNSLPNPKLHYVHGWSPYDLKASEKAFGLRIRKIVVSSYLKPKVESFGSGEVLGIINNGIDQSEYFNSVHIAEKDGVGTIYHTHPAPAKDPETILATLKKVAKLRPDVPIRCFGIERRGPRMEKGCYWRYPSIEKARDIYSRSLVWFVASRTEGFSVPVLEAMACGCVVVATDCGGTREMITDQENGFLVEVGDVDQMVDRILLLLSDDVLRKRMCLKAKETVNRFSWDRSIDKLENVLWKVAIARDEEIPKPRV